MFSKFFDLLDRALGREPPAPKPNGRQPAARPNAPGTPPAPRPKAAAAPPAPSPASSRPSAPLPNRKVLAPGAHIPKACANPGLYAREPGAEVWQFQVPDRSNACADALELHNQRVEAGSAHPTPLPRCDRHDCRCTYRLLADVRRGPRRSGDERREMVRFEVKKVDRRKGDGRRKEDGWSGAKP